MKNPVMSLIAAAALASSASAQDAATARAPSFPMVLINQVQPGFGIDNLLANSRRSFRNLDADGNGRLDAADVDLHRAVLLAGLRADSLRHIMASDFDGDGKVTPAELRIRLAYDARAREQPMQPRSAAASPDLMTADTDKDGSISYDEAARFVMTARTIEDSLDRGAPGQVLELLAFSGGVSLDAAALDDLAVRVFRSIDADANGTVSVDEFQFVRRQASQQQAAAAQQRRREAARAGCTMPKATPAAQVVLISTSRGQSLSTTTIGSQDNHVQTVAVMVEPGEEPLYVVTTTQTAMIWRFSGAVERIEKVVFASQSSDARSSGSEMAKPLAGATGLPAEKIVFLPRTTCLETFTEESSPEWRRTIAVVKAEAGKAPIVATGHNVAEVKIPSAAITTVIWPGPALIGAQKPQGPERAFQAATGHLMNELLRFYPGGTVEIDPATVVASEKAERYEVLPSQAGLLQLVQSGALERSVRGEYLIRQKIRFPPHLFGAHSARFVLMRGVPQPDGDPGHSCVISEETGRAIAGVRVNC